MRRLVKAVGWVLYYGAEQDPAADGAAFPHEVVRGALIRVADDALYHDKRGTLLKGPWAKDEAPQLAKAKVA